MQPTENRLQNVVGWLFVFLGLVLIWVSLSTTILTQLYPSHLDDFHLRVTNKRIHYILFLSLWLFPWLSVGIAHRFQRILTNLWFDRGILLVGWLLLASFFSLPWLILTAGLFLLYSWVLERRPALWFRWVSFINHPLTIFILVGFLAVLLLFTVQRRDSFQVLDLYHMGPRLAAVSEVMLGRVPYRDIFIHYGPLQDIVRPWVAFQIWGTTYTADQLLTPWLNALGSVFVFLIVTQVVQRKWWLAVAGFLILWRSNLHVPERVLPQLIAVFLFCRGLRIKDQLNHFKGKSKMWFGAAGFMTVLSCLYSFEIGLTLLTGLMVYFVFLKKIRPTNELHPIIKPFSIGLFTGGSLFLFYLMVTGSLVVFVNDVILLLTNRLPTWSDGLGSRFFNLRYWASKIIFKSNLYTNTPPLIAMGVIAYAMIRSQKTPVSGRWHQAVLLSSILFFQFFIYISRSDFNHWQNSTSLLCPLLALVLEELINWIKQPQAYVFRRVTYAIGLAGLLWLPLISMFSGGNSFWYFAFRGFSHVRQIFHPSPSVSLENQAPPRLGTMAIDPQKLMEIRTITQRVASLVPDDGYFFDFSNYGSYYFFVERKNPTRFGLVNYIHGDKMINECLASLSQYPPSAILAEWKYNQLVYRKDLAPIGDYILNHYEQHHQINNLAIFVPKKGQDS